MKKANLCLACLGALLITVVTIASCATTRPAPAVAQQQAQVSPMLTPF
ncbi:MAG: hypothetical protein ACTHKZ_11365 [Lysobacteraceae bacterium]